MMPPDGVMAPRAAWAPAPGPEIAFAGMTLTPARELAGAFGGAREEWIKLAERLRRRRAGESDLPETAL